ncbi:MAG TPA: hypothetical protein V6D23_22975 [Candidatus Obscuribacterales bacterium]
MIYRAETEADRQKRPQRQQPLPGPEAATQVVAPELEHDPALLDYEMIPDDEVAPEWHRRQG